MLTYPVAPASIHTQPTSTKVLIHNMERFFKSTLQIPLEKTHFLLAVSGGADSVALLCCFLWLQELNVHSHIRISVVHLDHALREESADEARAVSALCDAWGIPCFTRRIDIKARVSAHSPPERDDDNDKELCALEENARAARYTWFEECRMTCGAQWTVLAHHVGDLQEDVLMRLVRGAAWPALGGMTALDAQRHILRPLLLHKPEELRHALCAAHMTWIEDASNTDTRFFRNRIRHDVVPLLHEKNTSFSQNIATLWQLSRADKEHWDATLNDICKKHNICCIHEKSATRVHIPANALKDASEATRLRLYVHAMKLLVPHTQARAQTLFQLERAFTEGRGGVTFQLPNKIQAHLKKRAVTFLRPRHSDCVNYSQ